eukprot:GHVR01135987.1.p1 GENE.GHVR01135987.1~~GHVR01135987.1.p1  ORF type:complete len:299 (+),score=18.59 GHVR01135987.1:404-1300(+)
MQTDLCRLMQHCHSQLSTDHCRFFLYQVLKALKYMHSGGVCHRDLKPRNILVNSSCDVKIGDFGLARLATTDFDDQGLTSYVTTRWYRAPELLWASSKNCFATDIWSLGCVAFELLTGYVLFPGSCLREQLNLILRTLGPPSPSSLINIKSKTCKDFILASERMQEYSLCTRMMGIPDEASSFVRSCLTLDADQRPTADLLLSHPWMSELYMSDPQPMEEWERDNLPVYEFGYEQSPTLECLKQRLQTETLIWSEYNKVCFGNNIPCDRSCNSYDSPIPHYRSFECEDAKTELLSSQC